MELEDIRVLILDDEPVALEESRRLISGFVPDHNIVCLSRAEDTIEFLKRETVDIAFIDIEMPGTTGFSMTEYIHTTRPEIRVVFLTGHVELGAKSFDYEPFDFLGKPIDILRLEKTIRRYKASRQNHPKRSGRVAINTRDGFVLIAPEDISYIARENRKTVIHCRETRYVVSSSSSLEDMETIFSDYGMCRVHQAYLVPFEKIISVSRSSFGNTYCAVIEGGYTIPVSRGQYTKLRSMLSSQEIPFI